MRGPAGAEVLDSDRHDAQQALSARFLREEDPWEAFFSVQARSQADLLTHRTSAPILSRADCGNAQVTYSDNDRLLLQTGCTHGIWPEEQALECFPRSPGLCRSGQRTDCAHHASLCMIGTCLFKAAAGKTVLASFWTWTTQPRFIVRLRVLDWKA